MLKQFICLGLFSSLLLPACGSNNQSNKPESTPADLVANKLTRADLEARWGEVAQSLEQHKVSQFARQERLSGSQALTSPPGSKFSTLSPGLASLPLGTHPRASADFPFPEPSDDDIDETSSGLFFPNLDFEKILAFDHDNPSECLEAFDWLAGIYGSAKKSVEAIQKVVGEPESLGLGEDLFKFEDLSSSDPNWAVFYGYSADHGENTGAMGFQNHMNLNVKSRGDESKSVVVVDSSYGMELDSKDSPGIPVFPADDFYLKHEVTFHETVTADLESETIRFDVDMTMESNTRIGGETPMNTAENVSSQNRLEIQGGQQPGFVFHSTMTVDQEGTQSEEVEKFSLVQTFAAKLTNPNQVDMDVTFDIGSSEESNQTETTFTFSFVKDEAGNCQITNPGFGLTLPQVPGSNFLSTH